MNDDTSFEDELRSLLRQGRKIDAIKRYREQTGVGLREAKDAVEALEAGAALPPRDRFDPNLEQDLIVLLERGQKVQAIKKIRDVTGLGLREAKEAVEALAAEYGLTKVRSGCLGVVLLVVLSLTWLGRVL